MKHRVRIVVVAVVKVIILQNTHYYYFYYYHPYPALHNPNPNPQVCCAYRHQLFLFRNFLVSFHRLFCFYQDLNFVLYLLLSEILQINLRR